MTQESQDRGVGAVVSDLAPIRGGKCWGCKYGAPAYSTIFCNILVILSVQSDIL